MAKVPPCPQALSPDHALFQSLPGAASTLAPRLLAEFGDRRDRYPNAQSVQTYSGTAPVSFISGRMRRVHVRRACNKYLRNALHLWANESRKKSVWAQAYYRQKRQQGKGHATALRCLANRWLKILWKMWQDRTRYDEAFHLRNQVRHGSWVVALTENQPCKQRC